MALLLLGILANPMWPASPSWGMTFLIGAHIMSPKKWNLGRSRLSADAVAMLFAIPDEVARLREVAVVSKGRQSRLKKRAPSAYASGSAHI